MNGKVAYISLILWLCVKRKSEWEEKKERITLYIILLSSLYYFIGLFILFYWVICKNKNYDVGWVVKWVGKIDKVVFEDIK